MLMVVNQQLIFSAMSTSEGYELYSYDGNSVQLHSINPGAGDANPMDLVAMGDVLFFSADDGTNGNELFMMCVVNTSVIFQDGILTSEATGVSYQWVDCNNGYTEISGETNQTFTPSSNGSYAVVVTSSSFACPDTSACVVITNLGITDQEEDKWVVYPNPVNDRLFIDANVAIASVHLTALNGQQIQV